MPKSSNIFKRFFNFLRSKWKLILIILIILGLGSAYYYQSQAKNKVTLTTITPERGTLQKTIEVSGIVDAKEKARLRFMMGGKVVYLSAQEGDWVKKGQTIATIDRATLQKQIEKDLNNYMKERWDWEDTQDEIKANTPVEHSDRREVDRQQWDLNNSVIDVEIRDIAIKDTALVAPFAGILTESPLTSTGTQILGSEYFEIINPETLVFRGLVDEIDISQIFLGQSAKISLDAFSDSEISSEISYISYNSSPTGSGTAFEIQLPLTNKTNTSQFRLGMNGDVDIILEEKNDVLYIPIETTYQEGDQMYVDVATSESTSEKRAIETGLETDEYIEVISGLSETDPVVVPE